jgi:hypothetical protein
VDRIQHDRLGRTLGPARVKGDLAAAPEVEMRIPVQK